MDYKARFQPLEQLTDEGWQPMPKAEAPAKERAVSPA
jgi:arginyl-tRNA--protein-N-Asp/Glu arginylyltransferase